VAGPRYDRDRGCYNPGRMEIDESPRRVWSGLTIPGKKMVRVVGASGLDAGGELISLYAEPTCVVLLKVAYALNRAPHEGAVGPAMRDLHNTSIGPERMLFGAVITDIRDFLKLRFRASGRPLSAGDLISIDWPSASDPAGVVNFMISALDSLTRSDLPEGEFEAIVRRLRDLSRAAAREADPRLSRGDALGAAAVWMYEEPWD